MFPCFHHNQQTTFLSHLQPALQDISSQSRTYKPSVHSQIGIATPPAYRRSDTPTIRLIHTTLTPKSHNLARPHIHNVSNCRSSCPACHPPGHPAPGQAILRHANHAQRRSLFRASSLPAPAHRREPPGCRLGQAVQARWWASGHVSHIATSTSQARKPCQLTTYIKLLPRPCLDSGLAMVGQGRPRRDTAPG